MRISLVAAVAMNGVIGYRGRVPWHLPEDLAHFRELTCGHPCVMGRKTWDSLPGPLPGRRNLVVSRRLGFAAPGAEVFPGVESALAACAQAPEVFICGGGEIYGAALPLADALYLTEVGLTPEGDAAFPEIPPGRFELVSRRDLPTDPRCAFVEWRRVAPVAP